MFRTTKERENITTWKAKSTILENQNAKVVENKISNCRNWTKITETKQISSRNYTITPKYKTNLQKLNANTKLQKLKGKRNTKIITETKRKYQIAEAEGKTKYQILQKQKTKYHSKNKICVMICVRN